MDAAEVGSVGFSIHNSSSCLLVHSTRMEWQQKCDSLKKNWMVFKIVYSDIQVIDCTLNNVTAKILYYTGKLCSHILTQT